MKGISGHQGRQLVKIYNLLSELRLQGFAIGIDHYVRLERLLGRTEGLRSLTEMRTLLCPLFASNKNQQELFYEAFDRLPPDAEESAEQSAPEIVRAETRHRAPRWMWALACALLAAGVAAYFTARRFSSPPPSRPPVVATPAGSEVSNAVQPSAPAWVVWTGGSIVLLSFLLLLQRLGYRRRSVVLERARRRRPPFSWPIHAPALEIRDYRSDLFYGAVRQLRRRRVSDAQRLDIPQSIAATIEAGGFPCLCSKPDSELPEYLALIERASFRDHQALLFDRLAKTLEAEGLFLVSYFYDRDPRVCQPRDGSSTVRLNDLRKRHPEHRLLLFTAGEELIDPISGGLASSMSLLLDWRERVVLTPKERGAWGFRERTLEEAFVVLPATVLGLSQLADRLELPTRLDQAEPAREASGLAWSGASRAASVDDLRRYLGEPGFEWLCACAVYPELHWDMTLYLGALPALGKGCLREESLLRLACLPWFRGGTLPDNLRLRLLEQLSPAQEREARNAVVKLLRDNPARPGSFAASARELQILAQDVYLARNEPERLRRFLRRLKDFPQGDAAADGVFLRFLETAQLSRLAIHVPATVRTILFERGVPAFGPKRVTSVLRALPLALTAAWEIVRDLMARKGGKQTADRDAGAWEERYQGLVARRWSIALVLMLALFLLYYGYIVLIALNKPFLARKLGAVTPLGILLGVAVIVFSWLLAAVYFSWVNKTYYPEAGKLKDELTGKGIGPGRTALGPRGLSGRPEEVASPVALANGRPKPESAVSGQRVATSVAQASWRTEAKIVFSYLGVLAFVVLLIEKKDEEVKWHARNGSALLVCEIGLWVAQLVGRILHEPLSSSLACIQGLLTSALWLGILVMHFRCMAAGLRGRRLRIRGISGLADRFSVPHSESSGPAVDVVTWPGGPGVTALLVVGLAISTSLILAPISWYLAERELRAIRQGRSPAPGERIARASRIVGILGTLIFVINLFLFIWSSFMS